MEHTQDHIDCPACLEKAYTPSSKLDPDLTYAAAAKQWIESRQFPPSSSGRARLVSQRSLDDFEQYDRALSRFFAALPLARIHLGNIRTYQEQRAGGMLGPTTYELFARYAEQMAHRMKVSIEQVGADPEMRAIVRARVEAYPQREVGPNKINQEVGMLIAILRRAGVWTQECEENYEPLQHQESDIPRCLTPEEQERFLELGLGMHDGYIGQFSTVGIHCTLSTKEERQIQIGDVNLVQRVLIIRVKSAKNKYRSRTIPLTEMAVWAFERLIERANSLGSVQPQHYLFPFRIAPGVFDPTRPMTVSGVKKQWDEVRTAAGVPWFTPYMLRHTGCTRYAEDGCSIHTLLAMAGHMSLKMQRHYTHISEAAKRRTVERTYGAPVTMAKVPASVKVAAGRH